MIVLTIDSNFLLNKLLMLLENDKTLYDPPVFNTLNKKNEWAQSLLQQSMCNIVDRLCKYTQWGRIYVVADTRSNWRKEIYPEYKGNRVKDTTINWVWIYEQFDYWLQNVSQLNNKIKVFFKDGLEGDDIICYLTEMLNKRNHTVVIASGDGDFKQLLKINWENKYCNILWPHWMSKYKWFLPIGVDVFINKLSSSNDLFNLSSNNNELKDVLYRIMKDENELIEWRHFLFTKIITGDRGDNVKSVFTKTQKLKTGGTRNVGIGEASANKIWDLYLENNDPEMINFENTEWIESMTESIVKQVKVDDSAKEKIINNIRRNITLMHLSSKHIPLKYKSKLEEIEL